MPRRTPRLDEATIGPEAIAFRPARKFLHRLWAVYATSEIDLPPAASARDLIRIVRRYYRNAQIEAAAAALEGTLNRISFMGQAAAAFSEALLNHGKLSPASEVEISQADAAVRILGEFRDRRAARTDRVPIVGLVGPIKAYRQKRPPTVHELVKQAIEFADDARSCMEALLADRSARPQFRQGEAWRKLACEVRCWAGTNGLPNSIRKDSVASSRFAPGISPSLFVLFFDALQKEVHPSFRRPAHSLETLSDALDEATAKRR